MKKTILAVSLCVAMIAVNTQARGFGHNKNQTQVTQTTTLTDIQKDDLLYMYQEEKVARDVYKVLGEKWGTQVFLNIQQAEQRHMDAVKSLLIKYDIEVPDIEDEVGLFENEELQTLYNDLVEQGENTLEDALNVGVLIEETDISDLEEKIQDAPTDVQRVFSKLLRGSNNHLDAFNRVLEYEEEQSTDQ